MDKRALFMLVNAVLSVMTWLSKKYAVCSDSVYAVLFLFLDQQVICSSCVEGRLATL